MCPVAACSGTSPPLPSLGRPSPVWRARPAAPPLVTPPPRQRASVTSHFALNTSQLFQFYVTIKLNTLHDLLIISFPMKILTQQSNIQAQILYIFNNFGPDRSYSSVFLFLMSRFSIQLKVRLLEINGILSEFFSWIHHSPFNVSDQELSSGS